VSDDNTAHGAKEMFGFANVAGHRLFQLISIQHYYSSKLTYISRTLSLSLSLAYLDQNVMQRLRFDCQPTPNPTPIAHIPTQQPSI
jgi:hypothetical protein